jgi:putative transposase
MPKGLSRRYGQCQLHFITFSCYQRLPLLASARARSTFVKILGEVRDRYKFDLVGFVVMPEHIHLLLGEPPQATPSTVLQVLKQRVSRHLRRKARCRCSMRQIQFRFDREEHALQQFWQRRFYDFNVWSQTKIVEKLHYMHMNPVKRKLVTHPRDWPWSSFSFYARKDSGLLRIDPIR